MCENFFRVTGDALVRIYRDSMFGIIYCSSSKAYRIDVGQYQEYKDYTFGERIKATFEGPINEGPINE